MHSIFYIKPLSLISYPFNGNRSQDLVSDFPCTEGISCAWCSQQVLPSTKSRLTCANCSQTHGLVSNHSCYCVLYMKISGLLPLSVVTCVYKGYVSKRISMRSWGNSSLKLGTGRSSFRKIFTSLKPAVP